MPTSSTKSYNYPFPTPTSASSGHSVNQSSVQQLTKLGNILSLVENNDERGLIAMTKWMLLVTLLRY